MPAMQGEAVTVLITPQLVRAVNRLSGDDTTSDFIRTISFTAKVLANISRICRKNMKEK